MRPIPQTLISIEEARKAWPFQEDPGVGRHGFGGFSVDHPAFGHYEFIGFSLDVTEHEIKKGQIDTRYCLVFDDPGHPISMSYDWDLLHEGLTDQNPPSQVFTDIRGEDMTEKSAVHDQDLRDKVKLKCKNDWDLDLNEDQISMCIYEQEEQRLSLFHNQLWPNSRKFKKDGKTKQRITWDKSIEGYRAVAHRTGRYAGMDAPTFSYEKTDNDEDLVARVTVYRLGANGERHANTGEARFSEFVQMVNEWGSNGRTTGKKIPNHIWTNSPKNQLAVAAERQALRKAFQSCDDDQMLPVLIAESAKPDREPTLERSRGEHAPNEPAAESRPAPTSRPTTSPKEQEPKAEESKGKYVGIPKGGFAAYAKYNKDELIVMLATSKEGGSSILALDSGSRVTVNTEGYEIDRRDRTDRLKGGRQWEAGDAYYDGSKVTKTAGSKQDEFALRLMLDNDFEVRLDRWGKENKRKPVKKKADKPKGEGTLVTKEQRDEQNSPPPEHDPAVGRDVVDTTATKSPEAKAPGNNDKVDIESIKDVAMLRKYTLVLLKKWCMEIVNKRMSPKGAYGQFTGVVLTKGQEMKLDDYKVLYECLEEAIEEAAQKAS